MQPMIATVQQMVEILHERWGRIVDAIPEEGLNWQPDAPETNSIAQLVRHTMAVQTMLLARGLGDDVQHDHAISLRNDAATAAELHAVLDQANAKKNELLSRLDAIDLGEVLPHSRLGQVMRAWYVLHVLDHGGEHVGHAQLATQLYFARYAPPIG